MKRKLVTLSKKERQEAAEYYMDSNGPDVEEAERERSIRNDWTQMRRALEKAEEFPDDEDARAFLAALHRAISRVW